MPVANRPPVYDIVLTPLNTAQGVRDFLSSRAITAARSVVAVPLGQNDRAIEAAHDLGAVVLSGRYKGRGDALRSAIAHFQSLPDPPDIIVVASGEGPAAPEVAPELVKALMQEHAEMVLGVGPERDLRQAVVLKSIKTVYGASFGALPRYFAVRFPGLVAFALGSVGDGVDAEILIKAAKLGLHTIEIPIATNAGKSDMRASMLQVLRHATTR